MSCCGRGGSWFKNCGGGNTKLQHTWYEGIRACKVRSKSKIIIGHENGGVQQNRIDSSQIADMANYKTVIAATNAFTFTLSVNTSTPMPDTTPIVASTHTTDNVLITTLVHNFMTISTNIEITNTSTNNLITRSTHTPTSTSVTTQRCVNLLKITVYINLLFIILF